MSDALRFSRLDDIQKYGSDCALLLYNFRFWVETNYHEKRNQHEGRTWTYNSYKALTKWFPFFSEQQIRRMVTKLCSENGPLLKGNFNKNGYDKTSWYAFKDESFLKKMSENNESTPHVSISTDDDVSISTDRCVNFDEPIPDLKPNGKPHSKNRAKKAPSSKLFYCYEKRKIEGLTEADILQWKEIYKSLDIEMEIKKFEVYLFDCEKKYVNLRSAITNRLSSQVRFYAKQKANVGLENKWDHGPNYIINLQLFKEAKAAKPKAMKNVEPYYKGATIRDITNNFDLSLKMPPEDFERKLTQAYNLKYQKDSHE